ncbi:MAG: hypothetical protein JO147_01685 [Actinobacteria bacterium]|nr:hypothetical protein [Actinomycetota bacterium]
MPFRVILRLSRLDNDGNSDVHAIAADYEPSTIEIDDRRRWQLIPGTLLMTPMGLPGNAVAQLDWQYELVGGDDDQVPPDRLALTAVRDAVERIEAAAAHHDGIRITTRSWWF